MLLLHHRWGGMCRDTDFVWLLSSRLMGWFCSTPITTKLRFNLFDKLDGANQVQMFAQLNLYLSQRLILTKAENPKKSPSNASIYFLIDPFAFKNLDSKITLQISIAPGLCTAYIHNVHLHQKIYAAHCTILATFIAPHNCDIRLIQR